MPKDVEQMRSPETKPAASQRCWALVSTLLAQPALTRHVATHTVCESHRGTAVTCHEHADAMQGARDACAVVMVEGAARRVCSDMDHATLQRCFQLPGLACQSINAVLSFQDCLRRMGISSAATQEVQVAAQ